MRESGMDILRLFCIIGVICLHCYNQSYFQRFLADIGSNSVTLFFMMSGAFVLSSKKCPYMEWMKKTWMKLGIPWLVAVVIYLIEGLFFNFLYFRDVKLGANVLFLISHGYPERGWHLWYMYAFLGMYLIMPVIRDIRDNYKLAYVTIGIISWLIEFKWRFANMGWMFTCLDFVWAVIWGDILFSYVKVTNKRKVGTIICGMLLILLFRWKTLDLYTENEILSYIKLFITVTVIFVCFRNINMRVRLPVIEKNALWIYIFHIIVADFWTAILRKSGFGYADAWWTIIVNVIIIFGGSVCVCMMKDGLYRMILKR